MLPGCGTPKKMDDRLGHHVGDQLLQQVAAWVQNSIREVVALSRVGVATNSSSCCRNRASPKTRQPLPARCYRSLPGRNFLLHPASASVSTRITTGTRAC